MAVVKQPNGCVLAVQVQNGMSAGGTQLYKYLRYKNIKGDVTDDALFAVGTGLAGLQSSIATAIQRQDTSNLIEG